MSAHLYRSWARRALASVGRISLGFAVAAAAVTSARAQNAPASSSASQAQPGAPTSPLPTVHEVVDVVGVTPVDDHGVPRSAVAANVQTVSASDLSDQPGATFGGILETQLASVHLNEAQSNPFQPDLQFRGFVGSPLLGLPQGIAVYQDGVRINEPFGDSINWDLVPQSAIESVQMTPGSSPLFGLNALGGAMSIRTKTGFTSPGTSVRVDGGSFGRRWVDASSGGHNDRLSYFVSGRLLAEDGWRDFSPSRQRQLFGNVEWHGTNSVVGGTLTVGSNRLIGNGALPIQLLEENRKAIFTYPDQTETSLAQMALHGRRAVNRDVTIDATSFYRPATLRTINGDDSDYDECESRAFDDFLCGEDGDGNPVIDRAGQFVPAPDDDDELNGTNNSSMTKSRGWGGTLQATVTKRVAGRANYFIAGTTIDGARTRYEADTELATLTAERGTIGSGIFDSDASVRLRTTDSHAGFYLADYLTIVPTVTVSAAARYTHSTIDLHDQIGDELNGNHSYDRVDPSIGVTRDMGRGVTAFANFGISSRVPTPSELSCADPEAPCRLPNAFVADPPLDAVVAHTFEVGGRGGARQLNWAGSVFRTRSTDDILFISSGALTNTGHFENVGDTVRTGLEMSVSGTVTPSIRWSAAYTNLVATFASPLVLSSPNHPDAVDGEIAVPSGSRLPSIPRHDLKGTLTATVGRTTFGGNVAYLSSQYLRGDEANLLPVIDGHVVVNVSASHVLGKYLQVTGRIANLFGAEYNTFGLLGEADDVLGDDYDDPRFLSPAAPRSAWIGFEVLLP
jgi:outer membrane cobalamin receptor